MRNGRRSIVLILILGPLTLSGVAFAHGTEKHSTMIPADAQMKKLHAIMPMFSVASAKMKIAIEKGDATEVNIQANRILAAVPDLKKSKPHKNIKQITVFKSIAGKIGDDITKIVTLAETGNFATAKVAFREMEARCAECHTKFRD